MTIDEGSACPRCNWPLADGQVCPQCGWDAVARAKETATNRLGVMAMLAFALLLAAIVLVVILQRYRDYETATRYALSVIHTCDSHVLDDAVRREIEQFHADGASWRKAARFTIETACPIAH